MKKFEYKASLICGKGFFSATKKLDVGKIEKEMNRLGAEGWELVASKQAMPGWGLQDGLLCIFKRCPKDKSNYLAVKKHLKLKRT